MRALGQQLDFATTVAGNVANADEAPPSNVIEIIPKFKKHRTQDECSSRRLIRAILKKTAQVSRHPCLTPVSGNRVYC